MPVYEFRDLETGDIRTAFFPVRQAPELGEVRDLDGRRCMRILSTPQLHAGNAAVVHKYPYVSNALPRRLPGCACDPAGRPIIQSRAHERNIAARHGYTRD